MNAKAQTVPDKPAGMALRYTGYFVESVPRTVAFYEKAFGLKLRFMHEKKVYAEMETGQTLLVFIEDSFIESSHLIGNLKYYENRLQSQSIGAQLAFITEDMAADWKRVVDAGSTIVKAPELKPWGQTTGYVRDPDGILIELTTRAPRDLDN